VQQLHNTHHQVSLMVSHYTILVPFLGLCIEPACEAGLSTGMRRECVPPQKEISSFTVFHDCILPYMFKEEVMRIVDTMYTSTFQRRVKSASFLMDFQH